MDKPRYFILPEWLPKDFYLANINKYGDRLWCMFDDRILWTFDQLRERFGRVVMNDWYWGGKNQYRGWRPFDCKVGAKLSQHKFGRGGDGILNQPAEEIRKVILANKFDFAFQYISAIEKDVGWLHVDCRNTGFNVGILLI